MKGAIGDYLADVIADGMGSWRYILAQSAFIVVWIVINVSIARFDSFPFILLNLLFSTQASFAAPIIMMSQNRQSQKDREQIQRIEAMTQRLVTLEEKFDTHIASDEAELKTLLHEVLSHLEQTA